MLGSLRPLFKKEKFHIFGNDKGSRGLNEITCVWPDGKETTYSNTILSHRIAHIPRLSTAKSQDFSGSPDHQKGPFGSGEAERLFFPPFSTRLMLPPSDQEDDDIVRITHALDLTMSVPNLSLDVTSTCFHIARGANVCYALTLDRYLTE
jgi:hypothetical protein